MQPEDPRHEAQPPARHDAAGPTRRTAGPEWPRNGTRAAPADDPAWQDDDVQDEPGYGHGV